MIEDVYEKLRALLARGPLAVPPAPEIIEILKILFTEEEARVALGLGYAHFDVEEIAYRAGLDPREARKRLESLASKGLVYAREENGVWGYAQHFFSVLFEIFYMKGVPDETRDKLTPLWKKYFATVGTEGRTSTPLHRIIPIQEEVEHSNEVLPYEKLYEMIDQAEVTGITHCACKELQQNCDAPRESCMVFDEFCTFLVERGFARYFTREEMKQKLREFDQAGLIHLTLNSQDRRLFVCNCCSCCCLVLNLLIKSGNPSLLPRSSFFPVIDLELCKGCGTCADKRCPTKATRMLDNMPAFNAEICIGCGLCASGCPNNAKHMEKSADIPEPPAQNNDLMLEILQEQGKLESFMELVMPSDRPTDD